MASEMTTDLEALEKAIAEQLQALREGIVSRSREAGQEASGKTYRQIVAETSLGKDGVYGAIIAPVYFHTLVRGRYPGKTPYNFAELIMEWMKAKHIAPSDPKKLARFANAVAWKIRREGSKLYRDHRYIDLADTPIQMFEDWLKGELDRFMSVRFNESVLPDWDSKSNYI